jgi:NYN domain-containing protein
MKPRTLLVVDGDNLAMNAHEDGERIHWIRLFRYLKELVDANYCELFKSYRSNSDTEKQFWSKTSRHSRYYYSAYEISRSPRGRWIGYSDRLITELLERKKHEYDRFVLVSSDMDFDAILLHLRDLGKETVVVADHRHESSRRAEGVATERIELAEILPRFIRDKSELKLVPSQG